jgi:hypothetical protein
MINRVVAFILVLLIGNPVCCCALGCQSDEGTPQKHSCCSPPPVSSDDSGDRDDGEKGCNCSFLKVSEKVNDHAVVPPSKVLNLLDGGAIASEEDLLALPRIPIAVQCVSKWPPGYLPVASLAERLSRNCSYLL